MGNEKDNATPQGDGNSKIEASDSTYALPEEAKEVLNAWLLARRLRKYRQMKKLEADGGWPEMPGVARDFHSSSPGNGVKVDETADADVLAFAGEAGPEVAFVERETPEVGDPEPEDSDGMPVG